MVHRAGLMQELLLRVGTCSYEYDKHKSMCSFIIGLPLALFIIRVFLVCGVVHGVPWWWSPGVLWVNPESLGFHVLNSVPEHKSPFSSASKTGLTTAYMHILIDQVLTAIASFILFRGAVDRQVCCYYPAHACAWWGYVIGRGVGIYISAKVQFDLLKY
jgi:hypothetical protein